MRSSSPSTRSVCSELQSRGLFIAADHHIQILITGWYITPEVFLRRDEAAPVRLEQLLLSAAQRGVRVFILVWNETKVAFKFKNGASRRRLEALQYEEFQ